MTFLGHRGLVVYATVVFGVGRFVFGWLYGRGNPDQRIPGARDTRLETIFALGFVNSRKILHKMIIIIKGLIIGDLCG